MKTLKVAFRSGFEKAAKAQLIEEGKSDEVKIDQRTEALGDAGADTGSINTERLLEPSDQEFTTSLEPLMGNDNDTELVGQLENYFSGTSSDTE